MPDDFFWFMLMAERIVLTVIGLAFAAWLVVNLRRKRWRDCVVVTSVMVVLFGLFYVVPLFFETSYEEEQRGIYDTEVDFGYPVFEYDSDRSFHGDGYSIAVYELPESIEKRFLKADRKLLEEHPIRPDYRDHWDTEHWREAPFDPRFENYLSFALSDLYLRDEPKLAGYYDDIRTALQRKGTYYAFFKYDHNFGMHSNPGDIDLFIVDLVGKRVYAINHNT